MGQIYQPGFGKPNTRITPDCPDFQLLVLEIFTRSSDHKKPYKKPDAMSQELFNVIFCKESLAMLDYDSIWRIAAKYMVEYGSTENRQILLTA